MNNESAYEKLYNELIESLEEMHRNNVRRTRTALKSLVIIPTIFLILLFLTNSSKTIFLVLWIVSMFVIASVLIVIEYQDYRLQKMMKSSDELVPDEEVADEEAPYEEVGVSASERIEELKRTLRSNSPDSESAEKQANTEKTEATVG